MVFSTNIFIFLFLPIVLAVYVLTAKITRSIVVSNLLIVSASLFFYLWGSGIMIFILLFSICANFVFGKYIAVGKNRKIIFILGILINLGLLFYFKYANFFYQQFGALASGAFGQSIQKYSQIYLPIGISFYTFMAISYLSDIYTKKIAPAPLLKFMTYLTFFPHLVAGPIVRYGEIKKDLTDRKMGIDQMFDGFVRFSIGLGKKVIIANSLASVVDKIFMLPLSQLPFSLAWIGIISYTFQIYYDFSGYSDMAIGLAKIFGIHFPENFNYPYRASSISDFWRRWHITLSNWIRDYLYIPLGGNRKGRFRTSLNLVMVFFICGLWHGASWTFIVWGIYHGLFMVAENSTQGLLSKIPKCIRVFSVFIITMFGWILFRSPTLNFAFQYLKILLSFKDVSFVSHFYEITYYLPANHTFYLLIAIVFSFFIFPKSKNIVVIGSYALFILLYSLSALAKTSFTPFIYFQF